MESINAKDVKFRFDPKSMSIIYTYQRGTHQKKLVFYTDIYQKTCVK